MQVRDVCTYKEVPSEAELLCFFGQENSHLKALPVSVVDGGTIKRYKWDSPCQTGVQTLRNLGQMGVPLQLQHFLWCTELCPCVGIW